MQQKNKDIIFGILAFSSIIIALLLILGGIDFIYNKLIFNGAHYEVQSLSENIVKKIVYSNDENITEEDLLYIKELRELINPILLYQYKVENSFKESVIILTKIILIFTAGIFLSIALFFRKSRVSEWVGHMDIEDLEIRGNIYQTRRDYLVNKGDKKKQ